MQGSDFYGIQDILMRHAMLPRLGVFPYSVQHGWQHAASRFEADGDPAEIWVWSDRSKREIGAYFPMHRVRVVGSPYLYLAEQSRHLERERRHSLFILPHSSHFTRIGFSLDHLRDLVANIHCKDGGCDVLAYYLDVNESLCAALCATRARILINGGLWSRNFMAAFRNNIRMYRRVYFSSFGSAVLFARHEAIETRYVNLSSFIATSSNAYVDALSEASTYDPAGSGFDTGAELGVGLTVSPMEMRVLILEALRSASARVWIRRACAIMKHRFVDHLRHVGPALAMINRHNASIGV